jgi:predicted transcriptional regulator
MSKAVMLSIRPKWCEKICNGEKTIEVRKTRPKLETPFKCYIYCTLQGCNEFFRVDLVGDVAKWRRGKWADRKGNVIGEFTCDRIYKIDKDSTDFLFKAGGLSVYKQAAEEKCGLSVAMTDDELRGYLGHCQGYGWHMSDLRIYDTPKELSEFKTLCRVDADCCACPYYNYTKMDCDGRVIGRPPQSWCYVEEM